MKIYIKIFSTTVSLSTDVSKKTLEQLVLEVGLVANTPRGGWGVVWASQESDVGSAK